MTIEQIIQLTQAGFSADQITALAPLVAAPAPAKPTPAPVPTPAPAPAEPTPAPAGDGMEYIRGELERLTALIQKSNINASQMPTPKPQESPEDILASIIAPPAKK